MHPGYSHAAHKTWTSADLASSMSVLAGVTFDPATVTAALAKIHDIVPPTPTPTPRTHPAPNAAGSVDDPDPVR